MGLRAARRCRSADVVAQESTVIRALLQILEEEGVKYVFGVPGGPLTALFEAMRERGKIRLVLAKHEAGAAYMAAAHARVTRTLAVCCATSGPGATNALTGVASAFADSLPVLVLTGQVALNVFGKGAIQESSPFGLDVVELFRPITKFSAMLSSVERSPDLVRSAIRAALSGRRGPAHLSLPADLLKRSLSHVALKPGQYRSRSVGVDRDGVARAARLLADAKRPCVLAGHGVALSDGAGALLEFARSLRIPVVASPKGKGVFPESDPLCLGVLGFGGHELAEKYFESGGIDVLLVVGSSLNEFVTNAWTIPLRPSHALIQVDVDPDMMGKNYPVDVPILGDASTTLRALATQTLSLSHFPIERDDSAIALLRETTPRYLATSAIDSDAVPLKPQRLIRELREAMPEDAMLFVDNGTSIIWGTHYFEARRPDTYFIDLGLAAMGSAVAGVVGGALAAPRRRAVALVGDAAFAMHGFEVHTAVEENLPIVWVVLNNAGHGMVQQGDTLMHGHDLGVSAFRRPLDLAAMARSVGAQGVRVESPAELRRALHHALEREGPTVIDAIVDANELVPTLVRRVQTLAKYFELRSTDQRSPLGG